jgi:zona occludens toxin
MGQRCDCYTQQGTKLVTPRDICLQIVKNGIFLDWQQAGQPAVVSPSAVVAATSGLASVPVAIGMQASAVIKAP